MEERITFVGLDVHMKEIAVATAEERGGDPKWEGTIRNEPRAIAKLMERLRKRGPLLVCYEAGPCGYVIQRQLVEMEIACMVVAPSLIPVKRGERVKTDRRDALKLAKNLRGGDLTAVIEPDPEQEALRDLARAREALKQDRHRVRQRMTKTLLRLGVRQPEDMKRRWTKKHLAWLRTLQFSYKQQQTVWQLYLEQLDQVQAGLEHAEAALRAAAERSVHAALIEALQCLRGVGALTAIYLVAELGDLRRFPKARGLMAYAGLVAEEYSSGDRRVRGRITKTGNSHVRFATGEAAWHYRHPPKVGPGLAKRRDGQPKEVVAIAEKADQRLSHRFRHLVRRGKAAPCAATAVSRELLGFIWAIADAMHARSAASAAA